MGSFLIKKRLKDVLQFLEVPDIEVASEKLIAYMYSVLKKNEIINLTTITDIDEFVEMHLIDSIACYGWPEIEKAQKIIDVGTGAGFPGVPLAILYPDKEFILLDSLNKRVEFLKEAKDELNIQNIEALHMRAEDGGRDFRLRESFDLCLTRAIASMPIILEYTMPFLVKNGNLYSYKALNIDTEIEKAKMALTLLGGEVRGIRKIDLPDLHFNHSIIVVEKVRKTSKRYPRKPGIPKKIPL